MRERGDELGAVAIHLQELAVGHLELVEVALLRFLVALFEGLGHLELELREHGRGRRVKPELGLDEDAERMAQAHAFVLEGRDPGRGEIRQIRLRVAQGLENRPGFAGKRVGGSRGRYPVRQQGVEGLRNALRRGRRRSLGGVGRLNGSSLVAAGHALPSLLPGNATHRESTSR
ncbi:hypothetical protein D3C72_1810210 [compost metagenome]